MQKVEGPVIELRAKAVKRALNKMKNGNASGPSELQIEMINKLGTQREEWMFELLREVWDKEVILRDWEQSMTESIFK